ncbi:hypothetical protein TBR22_A31960 [Luteitalea sp. TBR-22]|nr:hypothetical protein TBR22_A31960 [Luteitalea sp. TBR-22]
MVPGAGTERDGEARGRSRAPEAQARYERERSECGAGSGNRTRTILTDQGILSPNQRITRMAGIPNDRGFSGHFCVCVNLRGIRGTRSRTGAVGQSVGQWDSHADLALPLLRR